MMIGIDASRASSKQKTGTEAYAYHLIAALVPLAIERGHRVRLYFNQPPVQPLTTAPHEPVVIPFPRLWTHVRLSAEIHTRPPDIFFTPAHVIPITYQGPSVATVHDLGYHYFPAAHTDLRYLRWSTRHNARRSRRVLADSQATKNDLVRFYKIAPEKIDVVYLGRDPQLQRTLDNRILIHYQITAPYFLYLGTLQPRKNLLRVLEAFAQIAPEIPHQLVLAGKKGWLADPILSAIEALPTAIKQRILLPGFVAEVDKAALISGATALIYPSLYEGFGFPVLEAHACQTPVLTATNSSLREVAGEAALFVNAERTVEIAAGMRCLADDEGLRKRLSALGLVNVARFEWVDSAEKTLKTLEAAL